MARLVYCTLTGVDDPTSIRELEDTADEFTWAEWGMLYSPERQGKGGRYPSIHKIVDMLEGVTQAIPMAVHFCGDGVTDLIARERNAMRLLHLLNEKDGYGRVQLNFDASKGNNAAADLERLFDEFQDLSFITQLNAGNAASEGHLESVYNHAFLADSSKGTGLEPTTWPAHKPNYMGYAGGLGPENIDSVLPAIEANAGEGEYWIDMETRLRVEDCFSMAKARQVLEKVRAHLQRKRSPRPF